MRSSSAEPGGRRDGLGAWARLVLGLVLLAVAVGGPLLGMVIAGSTSAQFESTDSVTISISVAPTSPAPTPSPSGSAPEPAG
jgi:uncharacterized protein involved in exopolysaccharide biosynthesis